MKEKILRRSSSDRPDTATGSDHKFAGNPHGVRNVNQPQGPRVGNEGAHAAKRGNFKAEKASRAPLAKYIEAGYAERQDRDYKDHNYAREGQIEPNSGVKRFKK
jgi:hypothetical protein